MIEIDTFETLMQIRKALNIANTFSLCWQWCYTSSLVIMISSCTLMRYLEMAIFRRFTRYRANFIGLNIACSCRCIYEKLVVLDLFYLYSLGLRVLRLLLRSRTIKLLLWILRKMVLRLQINSSCIYLMSLIFSSWILLKRWGNRIMGHGGLLISKFGFIK